jgi:hypothetical protein
MAYFSSGSEGSYYEEKYCSRCIHDMNTCPIMLLHLMWNCDAVGKTADETKRTALDILWPRQSDGVHNADCAMFVEA